MKFTLSWLRDHLETTATLSEITDTLTAIGLEVENVSDAGAALAPFLVAEIIDAQPHPGADKLRVCRVNDGTSVRQVVCGAPNARAGIKVVLAIEGVTIPDNGMVIKKSTIRNVESNGMLCSARELGLGEDGGGIIELPAQAVVGEPAVRALGLGDPVIDIAVTPNRADCLGVQGIARDLAAAGLGTFKPALKPAAHGGFPSPVTVTLATEGCPYFVGCLIKGVQNGPSPDWLQQRLKAIGLRPISALVDITNYMTFTYGRPLHVFDAANITGNITVRDAQGGETLAALNDKTYTLTNTMIAIADDKDVLALGGIIGGSRSGCTAQTTDVFLESAYFDAARIAQTGRALAIDSDARYRFERGIDPAFVHSGAQIAVALIEELCGGKASELIVAGKEPAWQRSIPFDAKAVEMLGGVALSHTQVQTMLSALGCHVTASAVTPPSWRADMQGSADLVEECLRIHRYASIPSTPLPPARKVTAMPQVQRVSRLRKMLCLRGANEACSFAFVSQAQAQQFGGVNASLTLLNPINAELDVMRPSLLPGLLAACARNTARGFSSLALFEIGNVFKDATPQGQQLFLAGIRSAEAVSRNPFSPVRMVDLFDAKGDLFAILSACGLNPFKLAIDRDVPAHYHPSRSGRITLGGKVTLGYFGELHPAVLKHFGLEQTVSAYEVMLDAIPPAKAKAKSRPALVISNFQAVERDFAFVGDEKIAAADIVKAVETTDKTLIQSVNIFDIYAGKGIAPGSKSVAFCVTLQAMDRTLTDAEIETVAQGIIRACQALGLTLRQ